MSRILRNTADTPNVIAAKDTPPPVKTKPAKKPEPKAKPEPSMISLADLCREAKIDPKLARVRLRASSIKHKANTAWEWPKGSAEIKAVRKVIAGEE